MEPYEVWVREDLRHGDITTVALRLSGTGVGEVLAKQAGVIAGLEAVDPLWEAAAVRTTAVVPDGSAVAGGTTVLRLEGALSALHGRERACLNLLGRMSGIATATARLGAQVRTLNPQVRIAATRKTAPGLRHYDKWAVVLGGGDSHRYDAGCGILIKDRHLSTLGVTEAVSRARAYAWRPPVDVPAWAQRSFAFGKVAVEVCTTDAAVAAADAGADILLLDNLDPVEARVVAAAARAARPEVLIEISGRLDPQTIEAYAATADVLSVGWLTHSAPALDLSMRTLPVAGAP